MTEQLTGPAEGYLRAINGNDPAGFIALFAKDAIVDDAGRMIEGRQAIEKWAASDIFAANVTLDLVGVSGDERDRTMTARVDGTFDRTGLPNPLIMTFRVVVMNGQISALTCRLAEV